MALIKLNVLGTHQNTSTKGLSLSEELLVMTTVKRKVREGKAIQSKPILQMYETVRYKGPLELEGQIPMPDFSQCKYTNLPFVTSGFFFLRYEHILYLHI